MWKFGIVVCCVVVCYFWLWCHFVLLLFYCLICVIAEFDIILCVCIILRKYVRIYIVLILCTFSLHGQTLAMAHIDHNICNCFCLFCNFFGLTNHVMVPFEIGFCHTCFFLVYLYTPKINNKSILRSYCLLEFYKIYCCFL